MNNSLYFPDKNPDNYYHFLILMISNLRHIDYSQVTDIYIEYPLPNLFQRCSYILEILLCIVPRLEGCYQAIYPNEAHTVNYEPDPFSMSREQPYSKDAYIFIRNILLPHVSTYILPTKYDTIYISRERASKRKIINSLDFETTLKQHGVHTLYLEDLGAIEQMAYFYHASLIISPHGAGLTNILFCKENTKVIELRTPRMRSLEHFSHICDTFSLIHMPFEDTYDYTDSTESNFSISIDVFLTYLLDKKLK